jgi:hypothetical protein
MSPLGRLASITVSKLVDKGAEVWGLLKSKISAIRRVESFTMNNAQSNP